jgi:hypothetical protein
MNLESTFSSDRNLYARRFPHKIGVIEKVYNYFERKFKKEGFPEAFCGDVTRVLFFMLPDLTIMSGFVSLTDPKTKKKNSTPHLWVYDTVGKVHIDLTYGQFIQRESDNVRIRIFSKPPASSGYELGDLDHWGKTFDEVYSGIKNDNLFVDTPFTDAISAIEESLTSEEKIGYYYLLEKKLPTSACETKLETITQTVKRLRETFNSAFDKIG